MSFKYVNPGFHTLIDDIVNGITVKSDEYSRTGYSFWSRGRSVLTLPTPKPSALYGKMDLYLKMDPTNTDVQVFFSTTDRYEGFWLSKDYRYIRLYGSCGSNSVAFSNSNQEYYNVERYNNFRINAINTIYFEILPDNSEYTMAVWINGTKLGSTKNYGYLGATTALNIRSNSSTVLLSNIIISDEPFDKKEQIVMVPVTNTITDMTANADGTYSADTVGQQILQTLDVSGFAEKYGEKSQVTGIGIISNPAFRTANGVTSLIALQKQGDTLTTYGTQALSEQSADKAVCDYHKVSMTLDEMKDIQVGWKVGE